MYYKLSSSIMSISLGTQAPSVDKSKIATGCVYTNRYEKVYGTPPKGAYVHCLVRLANK